MRTLEIGSRSRLESRSTTVRLLAGSQIRELAIRAEEIGFDTVWIPDELSWRPPDGQVNGWWECSQRPARSLPRRRG